MQTSKLITVIGCILHLVFAFGEIVPLQDGMPLIVKSVIPKKGVEFTSDNQLDLVLNIVRNAGTYNSVVVMGFVWAAFLVGCIKPHRQVFSRLLQTFFFAAASLLGLVGLSLSILTASQSVPGLTGLMTLYTESPRSPNSAPESLEPRNLFMGTPAARIRDSTPSGDAVIDSMTVLG